MNISVIVAYFIIYSNFSKILHLYSCLFLTYDVKVSRDLFGAEAVGDFTDVVSGVFQAKVADCEPGQTPRPAGVSGQRSPIFQPADGWVWVTGGDAGQLNAAAHLHLP